MAPSETTPAELAKIRDQFYELDSDKAEFEHFVAALWELQHWRTLVTDQSQDGGVDVVATKPYPIELKLHIEVKNWKSTSVGTPEVRKYALPQRADADGSLIVTSGSFTTGAKDVARATRTKTIDGDELAELVKALDAEDLLARYVDATDVSRIRIASHVPTEEGHEFSGPQLTELATAISGLHAGYADQLAKEGIDSIDALATADPEALAETLNLSLDRLKHWVKSAQYLRSRPVGEFHSDELKNIGEGREESLQEAGITTLGDLAVANLSDIANALDINEDTAKRYRRQVVKQPIQPVTDVNWIGEERGDALASVGIKTRADLMAADPDSVASDLDRITTDFLRERIEDA